MPKSLNPVILPGDPTVPLGAGTKQYIDLRAVPVGGASGYVLAKNSSADYDLIWTPMGSGGGTAAIRSAPDYDNTTAPTANQAIAWSTSSGKYAPTTLTPAFIGAPPVARQVIAGAGLIGGGDLTADRTLAVAYGSVAGTAVQGNDARIVAAATYSSQYVSVTDYGAVADYNASTGAGTDNTAAFNNAINAAGGRIVFVPPGRYKTLGPIVLKEGTHLLGPFQTRGGAGFTFQGTTYSSAIDFYGAATDNAIQGIGTTSHSLSRVTVECLSVYDHRTTRSTVDTGSHGVYLEKCVNQVTVKHMDIRGFTTGAGVKVSAVGATTSDCVEIEDIWSLNNVYGVYLNNLDNNTFVRRIMMDNDDTCTLAVVRVGSINGVVLIEGVKHETGGTNPTILVDANSSGTLIDGVVSRVGTGGPVVQINGSGSGVYVRDIIRQNSGVLLQTTNGVADKVLSGVRLGFWTGGTDGIAINQARIYGDASSSGTVADLFTDGRIHAATSSVTDPGKLSVRGDTTSQQGLTITNPSGSTVNYLRIYDATNTSLIRVDSTGQLNAQKGLSVSGAPLLIPRIPVNDVDYTVGAGDGIIGVIALTASRTITLPTPSAGRQLIVKDESGQAGTFTINIVRASASHNIDGGASVAITTNRGSVRLYGVSGSAWAVLSDVQASRQVLAGTGLTGGGALSSDVTLAVAYGTTVGTAAQGNDIRITGAVQTSAVTTKGDLLAATGSAALSRLGVGTDGQVLTADSTQATGMKWTVVSGGGGGGAVSSVAGKVGAVTLVEADVTNLVADLATKAPTTRQILAGTGLTGGGDLTVDRTLAVAYGSTAGTAAQGNDIRLSDARTPLVHASTHASGGSDPVTPTAIGAAPTQDYRFAETGPTPSSILNIGNRAGRNHYSVQISRLGDAAWFARTCLDISAGYEEPGYYEANAAKTGVTMTAYVGAPTTSGSTYARVEHREQDGAGNDYNFDALDANTHRQRVKFTIGHLMAVKPEVVVAQLHNGTADRVAIRTQLVSGTVRLRIRINGATATFDASSPISPSGTDLVNGAGSIVGVEFDSMIEIINGTVRVYVARSDGSLGNMTTPVVTSTALTSTGSASWYFKTGCYLQSQAGVDGDSNSDYASVALRDLTHFHTGWPAITPYYATALHAASHAVGGYDAITPAAIGAAARLTPVAKSISYTAAPGELVLADASGGPITITLSVIAGNGQVNAVKKVDSSTNIVTVAASAGNTVGSAGAASVPLRLQDQVGTYLANGTNWVISSGFLGLPSLDARFASVARQIFAGTGLTGGGDLSADRTLSVLYGTVLGTAAQGNDRRFNADGVLAPAPSGGDDLAALLAAQPATGRLVLGAGTYLISGQLPVGYSQDLVGQGGNVAGAATVIKCTAAGAGVTISNAGGISGNFAIDGNSIATAPLVRTLGTSGAQRTFLNVAVYGSAQDNVLVTGAQNDTWIGCDFQYPARDNFVMDQGTGGNAFYRCEFNGATRYQIRFSGNISGGPYDRPIDNTFHHCIFERENSANVGVSAVYIDYFVDHLVFDSCSFYASTNSTGPRIDIQATGSQVWIKGGRIQGLSATTGGTGIRTVDGCQIVLSSSPRFEGLQYGIYIVSGNPSIYTNGQVYWSNVGTRITGGSGTSGDASMRMRSTSPVEIWRQNLSDRALAVYQEGESGIRLLLGGDGSIGFNNGSGYTPKAFLYSYTQNVLSMPAGQMLQNGQGVTSARPAASSGIGVQWWDTTLSRPIFSDGASWYPVVLENDARLTNSRTPTSHAATHATTGSDPVTPQSIGAQVSANPLANLSRYGMVAGTGMPTTGSGTSAFAASFWAMYRVFVPAGSPISGAACVVRTASGTTASTGQTGYAIYEITNATTATLVASSTTDATLFGTTGWRRKAFTSTVAAQSSDREVLVAIACSVTATAPILGVVSNCYPSVKISDGSALNVCFYTGSALTSWPATIAYTTIGNDLTLPLICLY